MSYEDGQPKELQSGESPDEFEVEAALRHFRREMHAWSEREMRPRAFRKRPAKTLAGQYMAPVLGWGLAAGIAVAAIGVPVSLHHQRQLDAARLAARQQQRRQAAEAAARLAANSIDDDVLMQHVDSDIAQDAPDAMEPLASLMRGTETR